MVREVKINPFCTLSYYFWSDNIFNTYLWGHDTAQDYTKWRSIRVTKKRKFTRSVSAGLQSPLPVEYIFQLLLQIPKRISLVFWENSQYGGWRFKGHAVGYDTLGPLSD